MTNQQDYSKCLVCGYQFGSAVYDEKGELQPDAFYSICPSCGYEYAYTDIDLGYTFQAWRHKWIKEGMPWTNEKIHDKPPKGWNPKEQLNNIGVTLDENNDIVKDIDDPAWHWVPNETKGDK